VSNGFRDYRVARNSWQSITESVGEDDTHSPTNGHIGFPFPSGQTLKSFACQRNLGLRIWHSARLSVSEAIVTLNRYHVAPRLEDLTRRTGPSGIPPGKCRDRTASRLRSLREPFFPAQVFFPKPARSR